MGIFKKIKQWFSKSTESDEISAASNEEITIQSSHPSISADFSSAYNPVIAENGKFVAANLDDPVFDGATGIDMYGNEIGKFVMLTHSVNDLSAVDFTRPYVPFQAENGKFVPLNLDESITGYPSGGLGKYAVLTYDINPNAGGGSGGAGDNLGNHIATQNLNMAGFDITNVNLMTVSSISASCGTSEEWCSTYTTVCANSALWQGAVGGGIVTINGATGPAVTIGGTGGVSVSTNAGANSIIISAAEPFDSTEIESASGNWNSTYTTVSTNSAIWDSTYTIVTSNSASWAPQNLWATITADTGNTTADNITDTLYISGGIDISTRIVGDTVAIDYVGADPILNIVRESSSFTLPVSDQVVLVSAVSAIDAILPPANGNAGIIYTVKKIDESNNIVTLSAAEFIDDANTYDIKRPYDAIRFISDDIQWWII